MKQREMFVWAVRILGLVFLYHGLLPLPKQVWAACSAIFEFRLIGLLYILLEMLWPLLVAFVLLRWALFLVWLACPEEEAEGKQARTGA